MHWPLLHGNHPSGQVFDAKKYNIINYRWFCAHTYKINLIALVLVIEFARIYHHAVMQTLLNVVKIYLAFIDRLRHRDDLISRTH